MTEVWSAAGQWVAQAWARTQPGGPPTPPESLVWAVVVAVVLAVALPASWRVLRVLVTVVHELGHGLVGVLCGRRFTGLVLRADMSGHAVTVGPARGPGRVLTTWAGYPAPAVVGVLLVRLAAAGWAPTVLAAAAVLLVASLVRVRSFYTAAVMLAVTAGTGLLWWWGRPGDQALVLLGIGLFLLVGAWRHLGAVAPPGAAGAGSDPVVLARLTRVPAMVWNLSFVLVLAGATWLVVPPVVGSLGV